MFTLTELIDHYKKVQLELNKSEARLQKALEASDSKKGQADYDYVRRTQKIVRDTISYLQTLERRQPG